MGLLQVAVSLGAVLGANALPSGSSYAVKERHTVPRAWTAVGPADKSESINLRIGIKQRNEGLVERHLIEVSDPEHERYGQHLSAKEIADIVRPEEESVRLVHQWLQEHGVEDIDYSPSQDWISVIMPIEKAEELLQTKYTKFKHTTGEALSRAPEWSLPQHLHEHIDVVQPTTSFLRLKPEVKGYGPLHDQGPAHPMSWWEHTGKHQYGPKPCGSQDHAAQVAAVCNASFVTLDCLRTVYGTIDYQVKAADKNSVAINNYLNETNRRDDAYQFLSTFRPEAKQAAYQFQFEIIDNAANYQGPNITAFTSLGRDEEGNLDAQEVLGISWPTPMKAVSSTSLAPCSTPWSCLHADFRDIVQHRWLSTFQARHQHAHRHQRAVSGFLDARTGRGEPSIRVLVKLR